jgi:alpha/beta superfamily hydrolase
LEELRPFVESLPAPKKLIVVAAQDHFFVGGLDKLEEEIAGL